MSGTIRKNSHLYRSRTDAMLGGVCAGLGEYLVVDATLVRIFFVLLTLGNGIGIFIYWLLWFIVPLGEYVNVIYLAGNGRPKRPQINGAGLVMEGGPTNVTSPVRLQWGRIVGLALVVITVIYLLENAAIPWLQWFRFDLLWPLLLIVGGLALLLRRAGGKEGSLSG